MPFGLCNAPATFQRLMEANGVLLVYLDDILVFSKDFERHVEILDLVFAHLGEHGLKLKPKKCFLLKPEVKFLGHVASAGGVRVDMEKVKALGDWPAPRSVKEVHVLLPAVRPTFWPTCMAPACSDGQRKEGWHEDATTTL